MAKILLVDDEPEVAGLMSDWLRLRGYDALRAGDGLEALRIARTDSPDLILLDAFMPGLDGLETGRRLRGQPETSRLPIVLIAGEDPAGAQVDRLMSGASDVVTRPVVLDDLAARIRALLAGELAPHDRADTLARRAVSAAVSSLPCLMAWLFGPDDITGGIISRAAAAPSRPEVLPAGSAPIYVPADAADWWPARSLQTHLAEFNLALDDLPSAPDDPIIQACLQLGAGYVTLIPVSIPGEVEGLLLLASRSPLDTTQDDARLALLSVTNQASLALEAGREAPVVLPQPAQDVLPVIDAPSQPEEPAEAAPAEPEADLRFAALEAATLAVLNAENLDAALLAILNQTSRGLDVKLSAIVLRAERDGQTLVVHRAAGLRARRLEDASLRLEGSLAGKALLTGRPAQAGQGSDASAEIRLIERTTGLVVTQAAAAPLTVGGQAAGALLAVNPGEGRFAPGEIDLLQSLANLTSIAIGGTQGRVVVDPRLQDRAARLEVAYDDLRHTEQARDRVLENVSHSVRTPLTAIMGYADLMLHEDLGPVTDTQREGLKVIDRKTREIGTLVDDVMAVRQVGHQPLQRMMASLDNLARMALDALRPAADQAGIRLESSIDDFLPNVYIDRERMFLVLEHLLANAIQFSPAGSSVTLTLRDTGKALQLQVIDHGIGIPPEDQAKVWEQFYRVEPATSAGAPGKGVGLTVVKQVVEAHGGRVWLTSAPGKGSTFAFSLPKTDPGSLPDFIPSF